MTQNQFEEVAQEFAHYAGKEVEFVQYIPSADKNVKSKGFLKGVGVGVNNETFIIAQCGHGNAIHYSRVKICKK